MKIHSYLKTSLIDYPAHLACVIFSCGCNWNCWYCLNQDMINFSQTGNVQENEILQFLDERKNFLDGVVLCGGEPTLQPDLENFILKIKNLGYDVKLDTNGTNPDILKNLIEKNLIDYVAMDIKAPLEEYEKIVGKNTCIDKVKKSINLLKSNLIDYEFRTTCATNLTEEDLYKISEQISGSKVWYLQRFIVPEKFKNNNLHPYSEQQLLEISKRCNKNVLTKVR